MRFIHTHTHIYKRSLNRYISYYKRDKLKHLLIHYKNSLTEYRQLDRYINNENEMSIFRATQVSTLYILYIYILDIYFDFVRYYMSIFQVFKIYFILYFFLNIMIVVALEEGKLLYEKKMI